MRQRPSSTPVHSEKSQKTSAFGNYAEDLAAQFLVRKGYEVLARNWRRPWGELDIIARIRELVVFVEVKAGRGSGAHFQPELHVTGEKIKKLLRTARTYLVAHDHSPEQEWQIDVISVTVDVAAQKAHIRHYKNIEVG
ncbi:MAG: YraN family protein [Patescibacteria group bacterium]